MSEGKARRGSSATGPHTYEPAPQDDLAASLSPRDVTVAQILALGADAILPASLGYYLGRLDAEDRAERARAQAGFEVAHSPEWHRARRQPRYAELARRRGECTCRRSS